MLSVLKNKLFLLSWQKFGRLSHTSYT